MSLLSDQLRVHTGEGDTPDEIASEAIAALAEAASGDISGDFAVVGGVLHRVTAVVVGQTLTKIIAQPVEVAS